MPAPIPTPVPVYRGDDCDFPPLHFHLADGTDIDLSASTWTAQWRRYPNDKTFLPLSVDASLAAQGWIYISAPASVTAKMPSDGVWDLQGTTAGKTHTSVYGSTILTKDVTRG